ncbi:hypothetical protein LV779_28685 [Streptomyces thinghirensis]|nr:hypothetical protein [Streptomyces thinghirensis]
MSVTPLPRHPRIPQGLRGHHDPPRGAQGDRRAARGHERPADRRHGQPAAPPSP